MPVEIGPWRVDGDLPVKEWLPCSYRSSTWWPRAGPSFAATATAAVALG